MSDNDAYRPFNLLNHAQDHLQELARTIEVRPGAEVDVKYLGKKAWRKLRKRLRSVKGSEIVQDEAAYNATHKQLARAVTGWRGMTKKVVLQFLPVDPEGLPEEIPFDQNNVLALLLYSGEFFQLISDAVDDLEAFIEAREKEERGN
ncbi:MAG: hypothetical protein K9K36_16575 [Desulfarculaceae bacterium]|nr:hypothetical protein [Desulfarculaceae bacterium]MCF8066864.1 hypothetical protein [Desulfarculaceae bacterium]MCF8124510.1 hypothetical protein [Desulfarculaceae bacterium]